jgi:hypothetical protein
MVPMNPDWRRGRVAPGAKYERTFRPLTPAAGTDTVATPGQRTGIIPMRAFRALALAAALFACAPAAQAQVADLSKLSCKDFLGLDKDSIVLIWAWLYGYFSDQDADPIIDFGKLTGQGARLAEFCKSNPGVDIIRAAEPIYE